MAEITMQDDKWISLDEAAEYLGVKPITVREWIPITIDQATDLLASAGYTFVLSDKFEKTIKKIIEAKNTKKLTRIDVIDLILYELGLPVFNSAS